MATETLTPSCPEAAFRLCVRSLLDGHDAQWTIRRMTPAEFKANVEAVRGLLHPAASPASQPSAPAAAAPPTPEGWCGKHSTQMTLNQKEGRSWWSHKTAEGWCKGK